MGWFDDNGTYEQGGITGGAEPGGYAGNVSSAAIDAGAAPFNQYQQVGHDGTINGMNREQWRDAWQSSGVTNKAQAQEWLAKNGGKWIADNGTITTPFGETGDMLIGARTGNGKAGWLGDGSGQTGGGEGAMPMAPAFSAAMGQAAAGAADAAGGGRVVGGGNYLPADYQYEKFDPSTVDVNSDPGVAFRMKEATRALQNSAAAKGTLISGGFAKALNDRTQDYASQEYGNAFNRALGVNQANNQGRLAGYSAVSGAHLGQGNLDLGFTNANNNYALGVGQLALGNKNADQSFYLGNRNADISGRSVDNSYALGQGQLGLGYMNYGLNADNQNFNQGYSLANMGQQGAAQAGSYGSSYGNQAGNYMTGAANAQAAGGIGAANAWGNAFNNGAGTIYDYYSQKKS